jgi:hypothetical protein
VATTRFSDNLLCIPDACKDILVFKSGILFEDNGFLPSGGKKSEDEIDRDPGSPDNRFACQY